MVVIYITCLVKSACLSVSYALPLSSLHAAVQSTGFKVLGRIKGIPGIICL